MTKAATFRFFRSRTSCTLKIHQICQVFSTFILSEILAENSVFWRLSHNPVCKPYMYIGKRLIFWLIFIFHLEILFNIENWMVSILFSWLINLWNPITMAIQTTIRINQAKNLKVPVSALNLCKNRKLQTWKYLYTYIWIP
jgi:hypothetical protein